MKHKWPHCWAAIFSIAYAVLVFLAHLPILFPPHDALDGIFVVVLTLPWSVVLLGILDVVNPKLLDVPLVGDVGILVCAAINFCIIYLGAYWITRAVSKRYFSHV